MQFIATREKKSYASRKKKQIKKLRTGWADQLCVILQKNRFECTPQFKRGYFLRNMTLEITGYRSDCLGEINISSGNNDLLITTKNAKRSGHIL